MTLLDIDRTTTEPVVSDPDIAADIARFEIMLNRYLDGELEEDVFRSFRLANGVYGQRQGGRNQMLRVRIPYGRVTPDQLRMLGDVVTDHSRGWGHITTRQNIQMHFVQLTEVVHVLKRLGSVGLSTREACGDTVRNIQGCHLAGACPLEVLDISPWADAADNHFIRNPLGQRLPRKFKINFSGCSVDCGQAMFNDAGIVAVNRHGPDGTVEQGFRVYVAGGLGASPHAALAVEEFTAKEDLLPTIEAILRVFDQAGNRENKLRARMKWLVDELGWDETQRRILAIRRLLPASATWPGGIPAEVIEHGDEPAGGNPTGAAAVVGTAAATDGGPGASAVGHGVAVVLGDTAGFARWSRANVVRGAANGAVSAYAWCELGDITTAQFHGLAAVAETFDAEVRVTNRQNFVLRGLTEDRLPELHRRLDELGMARPGAELSRDIVSCPGADTCNLAITQSRGLAKAIGEALELEGLAEVGGVRLNISGCMNSCGQHHVADIGLFGVERRAHGRSLPGYQMLLGGHLGQEKVQFGDKALRLPAKAVPEATVRVLRRFTAERRAGEAFRSWLERVGGAAAVAGELADLNLVPSPDDAPGHFIDFDEAEPFRKQVGESECA